MVEADTHLVSSTAVIKPETNLASHNSSEGATKTLDCADCVVTFRHPTFIPFVTRKVLLNELVVRQGIGVVHESEVADHQGSTTGPTSTVATALPHPAEVALLHRLKKAEDKARKQKLGVWRATEDERGRKNESFFGRIKRKLLRN